MMHSNWLYEIILLGHSLSLIGYIIYFISSKWKVKRLAFTLFIIVWILQTTSIVYEIIATKTFPIVSLHDGVYFYVWILLTFTLLLNALYQIQFFVLLTNVFTFFMTALSMLLNAQQQSIDRSAQLIHEILVAHITFSIISYSFFTVAFLLAFMYLIQYYLLKRKKGLKWMWRFTNLTKLDLYSYYAIVIGVPLLSIGLILGVVWAYVSGDTFYWFDLKTIGSILLLIIYSLYLLLRQGATFQGKSVSVYSSATFLVLLVNFFLFSTLSQFH